MNVFIESIKNIYWASAVCQAVATQKWLGQSESSDLRACSGGK